MIQETLGYSGTDLLATLFGAWSVNQTSDPFLYLPVYLKLYPADSQAHAVVPRVLESLSIGLEEARKYLKQELIGIRGFAKAYALFSRYPFIRLREGHYLATSHPFVETVPHFPSSPLL